MKRKKHYKRMTRRKKIDWNYDSKTGLRCETHAPSLKWITVLGRKTNWTPVEPPALMCLSLSHKGRAERRRSWWLHHVTSLPEWGNRRWHLADSLTLADLLGVGWLLWFWNYSLDELEHFTTRKKKLLQKWVKLGLSFHSDRSRQEERRHFWWNK